MTIRVRCCGCDRDAEVVTFARRDSWRRPRRVRVACRRHGLRWLCIPLRLWWLDDEGEPGVRAWRIFDSGDVRRAESLIAWQAEIVEVTG